MPQPPFKLSLTSAAVAGPQLSYRPVGCCGESPCEHTAETAPPRTRLKLWQLDSPMYCSVIGTCIGVQELRNVMSRLTDLHRATATDLEVHHAAVSLCGSGGAGAKALHKALDRVNEAVLQRFATARDEATLGAMWAQAMREGAIPGAYWAVMTHAQSSRELRQKAFGDVHMLSHLVGASNRADLRRFAELEHENAELRARLDRLQLQSSQTQAERQKAESTVVVFQPAFELAAESSKDTDLKALRELLKATQERNELFTRRREEAEQRNAWLSSETARLEAELQHVRAHAAALQRELTALESRAPEAESETLTQAHPLAGRRVLYVGGRPSSLTAIRRYVEVSGGEFAQHGGGSESRSALLDAAILRADLAAFPVDCIDHESALRLKHLCKAAGIAWMPLRTASLGSFVAGVMGAADSKSAH